MEPTPIVHKLTAILCADVKGYSRLMGVDEEGTLRTLKGYRDEMVSLIGQHRGRVVNSPGDALLAEFGSVIDAVSCAAEVQRELAERNAELPVERRMEFRIGINLGDVMVEEDSIYGEGINIAARLESLAEGGGICISGSVYDSVRNRLKLEYDYLGEQSVKNIAQPLRVYRVLSVPGAAAHRVIQAKRALARIWGKTVLAVAAVLLVGVGAVVAWNYYRPSSFVPDMVHSPENPSIAVLPFINMSEDPKQEYFVDGMTEDLITDLSKVSGLLVISRNSVFTYKGIPVKVQQVSRELGVLYVLEGSVRKSGGWVRITAQLVDGTTGYHIWSERYDFPIGDVFAVQDKVTQKVVTALSVKLTAPEQDRVFRNETDSVAAYDALLEGVAYFRHHTASDYVKAVRYFKRAIKLDTNYGRAYALLASVYQHSWVRGPKWTRSLGVSGNETTQLVEKYLQMAMSNPTSTAHQVASDLRWRQRQHEAAILEATRAIELDSNDADSHVGMALALIWAGRAEEAIDYVKRAMRLDPKFPSYYLYILGVAHFGIDQFKEAVTLFKRALERDPNVPSPRIPLAAAYAHLGRELEAKAVVVELQKLFPDLSLRDIEEAWPYKDSADTARLLDGLLKAGVSE